jgi:hypothetical protein
MALFTDGPIASLSDLKAYENAVLDVASLEKVDASDKLRVAQREVGIELASFLLRQGMPPANVNNLSTVVVTEQMLHVHVLHALALIYRDAYNGQPNDTYKTKWREYAALAERSVRKLFDTGLGIVVAPLPRADAPTIAAVPGGIMPARYYFVSVAWIGAGSSRGALSEPSAMPIEPGTLLRVLAPAEPRAAAGWVVYAGESETNMRLQTALPLAPGEVWTEGTEGLRNDISERPEQMPDYYVANRRILLRG